MSVQTKFAEMIHSKFSEINKLKPQQWNAILQYILRKYVFAVLEKSHFP